MSNLSKVMDIFSDILTKESPIQGPGIPTKTSEPSKEVVGRGKKAARSREADASVPDDSTYVVGMMKERLGRQISRARREAQTARRDKAQKEMYEGTAGRQLKPDDPVRPRKRPSYMDMDREFDDDIKARTAASPTGRDSLRRMRRAGIQADILGERLKIREKRPYQFKHENLFRETPGVDEPSKPRKGEGWKLTRGPRGRKKKLPGEQWNSPQGSKTGTGGRSYRYRDAGKRGVAGEVSGHALGSDTVGSARRKSTSIDWKRGSDKYKNIDRATIRKPETFESMQKNAEKSQQGDYSPTLKRNFTPEEQKRVDFVRQIRAERGKSDSSTPPKQPRSARAMEEDRFDAHKRKMGIPADVYIKPGERHGFGGYDSYATQEGGRLEHMEKANILKAFGVPISMPGGKQRTLPILPTSEGGFFTKETGGRHSLHPVEHRPKTVTEKRKHPHADGGEEHDSGARGASPAVLGMIKAGKKIKAIKDMTGEERVKAFKDGDIRFNTRYREGHPPYSMPGTRPRQPVQDELPFSAEDRDNMAPTPDPHGDNLPEPTQRGGPRPGSRREGEIPKEGWKEAALLYPAHQKEQQGGRTVKTRVGDSIGGYPT